MSTANVAIQFAQRQQAQSAKAAAQLAKQQDQEAFALAKAKQNKQSNGFNLDAIGSPAQVASLAAQYDQVQVRNGQQSILFQRDTGAVGSSPVTTQSVVAADGTLKAVPAVGPLAKALLTQQTAYQQSVTAGTPAWERYAVPVIGGAMALVLLVIVLKGK